VEKHRRKLENHATFGRLDENTRDEENDATV